mgnify:CR=1 FL=1
MSKMKGVSEPRFYYVRDGEGRPVTTVCLVEITSRTDGVKYAYGSTTCSQKDLPYLRKDIGRRIAEQRARKVIEKVPLHTGDLYSHRSDLKLLKPEDLSPLERSLFEFDKPKAAEPVAGIPSSIGVTPLPRGAKFGNGSDAPQ